MSLRSAYGASMAAHYQQFIAWIVSITSLAHETLHVHFGLLIYFAVRLLFSGKRPWTPVLVVLAAEMFNEIMDRIFYGSWRWSDTIADIANTLFWPIVIVLVERSDMRGMVRSRLGSEIPARAREDVSADQRMLNSEITVG